MFFERVFRCILGNEFLGFGPAGFPVVKLVVGMVTRSNIVYGDLSYEELGEQASVDTMFEAMNLKLASGMSGWHDARLQEVFTYLQTYL